MTSPWKSAWYTSSSRSVWTLGRGEVPVSFFSAPDSAAADAAISASRALDADVLLPCGAVVFSSSAATPASRALSETGFLVMAVLVVVVVVGIGVCVEVSSAALFFSSTWSGDDGAAAGSWFGLASASASTAGGFEAAIGMCN